MNARLLALLTAVAALLACSVALAAAPRKAAPASAHVGDTITFKASGLKRGRYVLRLVSDDRPTPRTVCLARIGERKRTRGGRVTLTGPIPRKLTCHEGNGPSLGTVKTSPGPYHLLVSVPYGPTGSSGTHSFVRRAFRVRAR